jgi:hypothetical protein
MIAVHVSRNAGHPWDLRPGFDIMIVDADTQPELDTAVVEAEAKYWAPWLIGFSEKTGKPAAVFYKPCGAASSWDDSPKKPHPGNPPTQQ